MACEFEVCFPAGRCPDGTRFALESLDSVEAVEEQLSYFRPESQISRINRSAAEGRSGSSRGCSICSNWRCRLYEETGGAYDITSAPLWEAWGFARRAGEIPSEAQLAEARSRVGGHLVELDPARQTVRFRRPGVRINLGSIGKGYALDVCAERLLALGMTDFLLHGGQSSVLARGSPLTADHRFAAVPAASPRAEAAQPGSRQVPYPQIPVTDPVGDRRRRSPRPPLRGPRPTAGDRSAPRPGVGDLVGAIPVLSPRRTPLRAYSRSANRPARRGVLSATVAAPTAAMADALSTAFYVMGPEPSLAYCRTHPEIGLVMACPGRQGRDVETFTAGFDPGELAMCRD